MLTFNQFINQKHPIQNDHPRLYDFLHHLSSPTISESSSMNESKAHPVDQIIAKGQDSQPQGNLWQHLRKGFAQAFPDNEDPKVTKQKAQEARKHFRNFMTDRGGHSPNNNLQLTSENGKTALSSGEGVQTIGLALTPHKSHGYDTDFCPNASSECRENCLGFTAGGNKQYPEDAFRGKLLRTQYLAEHPEHAARLMSHEISENEKWSNDHHSVHNEKGEFIGYKNKKTGKISASGKGETPENIQQKLESNEYSTRNIKPGFRGNVTSDLPWEKLMPRKFFDRHSNTQFYDYTKNHSRVGHKDLPPNYSLALSHTGTGHAESNDEHAINALRNGNVVALVHQKSKVTPTHVENVETGERWRIANGDNDDNVYDRQTKEEKEKGIGVVSGLKLKGVKNEAAGVFANKVDPDGIIRLDPRIAKQEKSNLAKKQKDDFEKRRTDFLKAKKIIK